MAISDTYPAAPALRWNSRSWLRCHARVITLVLLGSLILAAFWFGSRYPALFSKAHHASGHVASMAFSQEAFRTSSGNIATRILFGAGNWLASMAIGMSFGVLFGALVHTALQFYPLRIGKNYTLNTLKGALVGMPMGVCANCAVPMACGLTRGNGRVEVALGYLFSSPSFNPVVIAITFTVLPWYFGAMKYLILLGVILLLVPALIRYLEGRTSLAPISVDVEEGVCSLQIPDQVCTEPFFTSARQVLLSYAKHVWMLFKPTISLMILASLLASAMLVLVPWSAVLSHVGVWRLVGMSLLGVFMPVPIALDVLFAGELYRTGVNAGYAMMFLMTLGTYSIIPAIYLWREISRKLSIALFLFFVVTGMSIGLLFAKFA